MTNCLRFLRAKRRTCGSTRSSAPRRSCVRDAREDEALAYAEALPQGDRRPWGYQDIAQFCERILVAQGREEEAYRRFGLLSVSGNTNLTMWRDLVKRYPYLDARRIPENLIETQGSKGAVDEP